MKKDGDMKKYLDIISNKNIKLSERVLIPVQQYPKVSSMLGDHAVDEGWAWKSMLAVELITSKIWILIVR